MNNVASPLSWAHFNVDFTDLDVHVAIDDSARLLLQRNMHAAHVHQCAA